MPDYDVVMLLSVEYPKPSHGPYLVCGNGA